MMSFYIWWNRSLQFLIKQYFTKIYCPLWAKGVIEEFEMDKIKLKLTAISEILGVEDVVLLNLVDEGMERQLFVTCEREMSRELQMYMMDKNETKSLLPTVMFGIMQSQSYQQLMVVIKDVRDGEYDVEVVDTLQDKHYPIRCSDGILFSLVCNAPLYASRHLMLTQSVPFKMGATKVGLPLTVLSDDMLKMSLEKAIETENYEMASNLRDELNKRHPKEA